MFPYSKVDNHEMDTLSSGYFARREHNKVRSLPWRHPLFWGHKRMFMQRRAKPTQNREGF